MVGVFTSSTVFAQQNSEFIPVEGSFVATKNCPAYISKNWHTNPDKAEARGSTSYRVLQVETLEHPEWVRLEVIGAKFTPKRWVQTACGTLGELKRIAEPTPPRP
jgi:ribonuclease T2